MKTERNILVAFLLNLSFSVFEFIGGAFVNSVAIVSDAIHDLGDAISIGISYFLERKSRRQPDDQHTYGYVRYSVMGSVITTTILVAGSLLVVYASVKRLINPEPVDYSAMVALAVVGFVVNLIAALATREGDSLNQRAVNLHMLEDVLGWAVVLVGAIIMNFTDISIIDPLMSIGVAIFILINAFKNLKLATDLFLAKTPTNINIPALKKHLLQVKNVQNVHHLHVWSIDGHNNYATLHVVTSSNGAAVKHAIKDALAEYNIAHVTIELEKPQESCDSTECHPTSAAPHSHTHHHH